MSRLLLAGERFWTCVQAADVVRGPAGFGFERFPDSAPRLAATYRNWRKAMEDEAKLRTTDRQVRLWRCVVDGWEPGVWRPSDIAKLSADERSFGARLARFGKAVVSYADDGSATPSSGG